MLRATLCFFAALVAGTGLALVVALGTASFSAAVYKTEVGIETPIYSRVQALAPTVKTAAAVGFVVGASVIVWMFASSSRRARRDPGESGPLDRSEV